MGFSWKQFELFDDFTDFPALQLFVILGTLFSDFPILVLALIIFFLSDFTEYVVLPKLEEVVKG